MTKLYKTYIYNKKVAVTKFCNANLRQLPIKILIPTSLNRKFKIKQGTKNKVHNSSIAAKG